jgi:hypothetical protein
MPASKRVGIEAKGGPVERGNTKHGPLQDDKLARETQGMVRGAPQRPHVEEWREVEPMDGADPSAGRPDGALAGGAGRDIELRNELARILTRDAFPVPRDELCGRLEAADASQDLTERVALLPADGPFRDVHQVMEALGINSPETRDEP